MSIPLPRNIFFTSEARDKADAHPCRARLRRDSGADPDATRLALFLMTLIFAAVLFYEIAGLLGSR